MGVSGVLPCDYARAAPVWQPRRRNQRRCVGLPVSTTKGHPMKGGLAWLIGIPIPVIILLYVFDVF